MTHVTKHHTEKPWEGYTRDKSWVSFKIGWNTVSVYNNLKEIKNFVWVEIGRLCNCMVVIPFHFGSLKCLEPSPNFVFMLNWSPEIANEALVLPFHHIQVLIQCLFFSQEHLIDVNCG